MSTVAVEVVYRGIFQKTLARNIVRTIVFAARKEGKIGTAFGRYGDSPERNGIPAKQFAIVSDSPEELEENLAVYEAREVDVTINVDDTMCKGVESWAWYGLQPINALTKPGGTLIVTSRQEADALIEDIHQKDTAYNLAIVPASTSFSGLWVYKDDHTDVRILGALAKVCPELVSLDSMVAALDDQGWGGLKLTSARNSFDRTIQRPVEPGEGNDDTPFSFDLPGWRSMEEGLVIRGMEGGERFSRRFPGRKLRSHHLSCGRGGAGLRTHPQRRVQEVQHPLHAAGHQLRHLHQVHPLLAPVPRHLLRRYS